MPSITVSCCLQKGDSTPITWHVLRFCPILGFSLTVFSAVGTAKPSGTSLLFRRCNGIAKCHQPGAPVYLVPACACRNHSARLSQPKLNRLPLANCRTF